MLTQQKDAALQPGSISKILDEVIARLEETIVALKSRALQNEAQIVTTYLYKLMILKHQNQTTETPRSVTGVYNALIDDFKEPD